MGQVTRRGLLLGLGAGAATTAFSGAASATIMRALSLPALVQSSRHILVVTPLASESHFEDLGRRRRIVTDTRVRIEQSIAKEAASDTEILVRTLGGAIDRLGEQVQGQPRFVFGQACVAFLVRGPDSIHYVNGMAQGHYPLDGVKSRLLRRSPDLPEILNFDASAVKALEGSELGAATARIRAAVAP